MFQFATICVSICPGLATPKVGPSLENSYPLEFTDLVGLGMIIETHKKWWNQNASTGKRVLSEPNVLFAL